MDDERKLRLLGILGRVCIATGVLLLFFIGLNMVWQTWVQVGPAYLPAALLDIGLGLYFVKQSKARY
jgi:hypothetical protein